MVVRNVDAKHLVIQAPNIPNSPNVVFVCIIYPSQVGRTKKKVDTTMVVRNVDAKHRSSLLTLRCMYNSI